MIYSKHLLALTVTFSVAGCAAQQGVKPTDLSEIRVGAPRAKVQAVLGQPIEGAKTEYGLAEVYTFNKGTDPALPRSYRGCVGGCAMGHMVMLLLSPLAHESIVESQKRRVLVVFGNDEHVKNIYFGKVSDVKSLKPGTTKKLIRLIFGKPSREETKSFGTTAIYKYEGENGENGRFFVTYDGNDRVKKVRIERARPGPIEEYDNAKMREVLKRAEAGDPMAQYLMGRESVDLPSKMKWFCLGANNGNGAALYGLSRLYYDELPPNERDHVKAYQYYLLGYKVMPVTHDPLAPEVANLAVTLSPSQIEAARGAAATWRPDPASCPT